MCSRYGMRVLAHDQPDRRTLGRLTAARRDGGRDGSVTVLHRMRPIGVVMADAEVQDPHKG